MNKKIYLFFLYIMSIIGFSVSSLLITNNHLRFQTLETISHYVCKYQNAQIVVAGDSIAAGGGNWFNLLGLPPFSTRNLAGDGYTLHQISGQISKALVYRPKTILVFGGTNDAFAIQEGRLSISNELKEDVLKIIELCKDVQCVFVLPPPTLNPQANSILEQVRETIKSIAVQNDTVFIDTTLLLTDSEGKIDDKYTCDGVHLTPIGYDMISRQIKEVLHK